MLDTLMLLRECNRVGHQHGDGQRAHAAGHRSVCRSYPGGFQGMNVPHQDKAFARELFGLAQPCRFREIVHTIHAHVAHRRAGGQELANGISIDGISTVSAVWGGASVITPSEAPCKTTSSVA